MDKQLIDQGYCVAPAVIDPRKLPELLLACRRITASDDGWAVPATAICSEPAIADSIFSNTVVEHLAALLGPAPVLLPSITVRKNLYVDWHVDAAFRDGLGGLGEKTDFLQAAIYLQDNDPITGGGLDVIPQSHKRTLVDGIAHTPSRCLDIIGSRHRIHSKAGDLVIWDARLLHASAKPRTQPYPPERYGLFMSFARREAPHHRFVEHLRRRALEQRTDGDLRENRRYADALDLRFPEHFSPGAAQALRSHGVSLAS